VRAPESHHLSPTNGPFVQANPTAEWYLRRVMVDALLKRRSAMLSDLAASTGLPQKTVAAVAADLESAGWLQPSRPADNNADQSARVYELAADVAYVIGVDVGGTKIAVAIGSLVGHIIAELTEPTDSRGGRYIADQITFLVGKLCVGAGVNQTKIQSVMVGFPGAIDPRTGSISMAPNIEGVAQFDLLECLRTRFGCVVTLENDVNLAMLGELALGRARGCNHSAFLALGTGAGLGILINGKLFRGATGAAGEIGYLPIGNNPTSLAALRTGAFECEVGALAIVQRYRQEGRTSVATAQDIFRLSREGDKIAIRVIDDTAHAVALGIAALQSILDLEVVILGGSIGIRPELIERVRREIGTVFSRPVRIEVSELGNRAGLIGAVSGAVGNLHDYHFGKSGLCEGSLLRELALVAEKHSASTEPRRQSDPEHRAPDV
jgi:predicted NBD/HSP70 family sugar kinase